MIIPHTDPENLWYSGDVVNAQADARMLGKGGLLSNRSLVRLEGALR